MVCVFCWTGPSCTVRMEANHDCSVTVIAAALNYSLLTCAGEALLTMLVSALLKTQLLAQTQVCIRVFQTNSVSKLNFSLLIYCLILNYVYKKILNLVYLVRYLLYIAYFGTYFLDKLCARSIFVILFCVF